MNNVYQPTLHGNIKRFARNSICSLVLAASLGFGGCAIDKNDDGRKKAVITLIEKYENSGHGRKAAELAQEAGLTERAIELYEKFGHGRKAAELAQKTGMTERAIELYEKFGHGRKAAELAQKTGMTEKAIELYEIVGEYDQAARLAYKIGKNRRAVELYKKHYEWGQEILRFRYATRRHDKKLIRIRAAALEAGMTEKAIELYDEAGYGQEAAKLAEKLGMTERAIDLYQKDFEYEKAAELASKHGMVERAIDLHERNYEYDKAAELADELGMKERAEDLRKRSAYARSAVMVKWFEAARAYREPVRLTPRLIRIIRTIEKNSRH